MEDTKFIELILDSLHDPDLVKCLLDFNSAMVQLKVLRAMESQCHMKNTQRKWRRCWVFPYLQRRKERGYYDTLMKELVIENPALYRNFTQITEDIFKEIVQRVTPRIKRELTFWRRPIKPGLQVAITLRYLATGESYRSLSY